MKRRKEKRTDVNRQDQEKRISQQKVSVVGAAGGIGQKLSLLLKVSPQVSALKLYDVMNCAGVAMDLSHINTSTTVQGFNGQANLHQALQGSRIVVVTAGLPRQPNQTRADLFKVNADIVRDIIRVVATACPDALVALVTNPVNSVVPVAARVLQDAGVYDPRRLFGVTTLDVVRANTFLGQMLCKDPATLKVPVIGGHSAETMLPVFSQTSPCLDFNSIDSLKIRELREEVQKAGTKVVNAKEGLGSATLSMAYAAARFVISLCRGLNGESDVIECTYVESDVTDAKFFSTAVLLGPEGVKKNLGYGKLIDDECKLLNALMPQLIADIEMGESYDKKSADQDKKDPCKKK
ncbi:malate dehydrogenase isoform X2 [Nilaparvata lugens]|uniref:malate dehydrogenase isoform X2 n=1 Tax=Nilaparvata lugens TaxID=108931 RepID=UPI000B9957FA|nr:malate dehydrogenase isoform X2 [Nilaparvata lugens]